MPNKKSLPTQQQAHEQGHRHDHDQEHGQSGGRDGEEDVLVRHIQTVPIRYEDRGSGKGRYHVGITPAIRAAGLDGDGIFRYIPEEADILGVVPALGSADGDGHLRDNRTYSVRYTGTKDNRALRLTVPEAALDALDIEPDPDAALAGDLPLLDVYTGDRMIAFGRSTAISIPTDSLPEGYDSESEDGTERVVLHQIQTTTPIMRSYEMVTAKLTAAIRHAGNGREDALSAIEYHPELADSLGGVVPATLHETGDGRTQDASYALQRVAANSGESAIQGFEAGIPENVLAALDLSGDDYTDIPLEKRPALTVYAGNRIIALARPGQREVAVDRDQTPGEQPPSLTDINGIGPALAERLPSAGYETVADLADATREDLLAIDGLGKKRVDAILADVVERDGQ